MANAPAAIFHLFDLIHLGIPSAVLSGIVGDTAHSFGYHLARNELPGNDYSVVLPPDRLGSSSNASALDISLSPSWMKTVTSRLLAAARKNDPRLHALREFCGTTDGRNTHPYDLSNDQDGPLGSWDDSHLWHVHLSFYRQFSADSRALAPIAEVITGKPAEEVDVMTPAQYKAIQDHIHAIGAEDQRLLHAAIDNLNKSVLPAINKIQAEQVALKAAVDALSTKVAAGAK